MLEKTFEKFIQKKHPELLEQLKLASTEQEKRQKRLEESMVQFRQAIEKDTRDIIREIVKEELDKLTS